MHNSCPSMRCVRMPSNTEPNQPIIGPSGLTPISTTENRLAATAGPSIRSKRKAVHHRQARLSGHVVVKERLKFILSRLRIQGVCVDQVVIHKGDAVSPSIKHHPCLFFIVKNHDVGQR